jgi:hypothetical protein
MHEEVETAVSKAIAGNRGLQELHVRLQPWYNITRMQSVSRAWAELKQLRALECEATDQDPLLGGAPEPVARLSALQRLELELHYIDAPAEMPVPWLITSHHAAAAPDSADTVRRAARTRRV